MRILTKSIYPMMLEPIYIHDEGSTRVSQSVVSRLSRRNSYRLSAPSATTGLCWEDLFDIPAYLDSSEVIQESCQLPFCVYSEDCGVIFHSRYPKY